MELTVISSETIKPSSPTPLSLRKFTLSMLDQKYTPLAVPAIHFYERPPGAAPIDVNRLKICLSQTLSVFYPLAGRVESSSTILCNDEGIPFVEAHVDCTLLSVVESISSVGDIDLKPFYPPRDRLIVDGIQFAIQINVFTCGGFAFAYYFTHKVTDATSVSYFFRYWTELVTQRREYAAQDLADFSSAVKTFPPVPMEEKPVTPKPTLVKQEGHKQGEEEKGGTWSSFFFKKHMVARSFVIRNEAVAKLKAMSISEDVTNPSRFEAVAGFLWKSILANSVDKEGRSVVSLPVDLRARVDPPLPVESMGNLFDRTVIVSEKNVKLHEMVVKIRASILKMKDLAKDYQGEKREEAKDGQWKRFVSSVIESKLQDTYLITPWYNKSAGFTKVDFGFGKPKWVIPMDDILNHKQRNMIILMESNDSDSEGFEAWLFLEEECIKCLESNPEFLALASPNF